MEGEKKVLCVQTLETKGTYIQKKKKKEERKKERKHNGVNENERKNQTKASKWLIYNGKNHKK
jgi:hypothetical protein